MREILNQINLGIKLYDQSQILFGAQDILEKLRCRGLLIVQFVFDAAAGVDEQCDRQRHIAAFAEIAEIFDLLRLFVVEHLKIVRFQARDRMPVFVYHREDDIHQPNFSTNRRLRFLTRKRRHPPSRLQRKPAERSKGRMQSGRLSFERCSYGHPHMPT